jgi:hypothetical protein
MTDLDDQATLDVDDAVDIDVATDPSDARTIVTGMTISTEEQASTGDYESYTPYASRRIEFRPAINTATTEGRVHVRREAMQALRDLQNDVDAAIDARLSHPSTREWPDGVTPTELEADDDD